MAVAKPRLQALIEAAERTRERVCSGATTWEEVEQAYLAALAESPQDPMSREYLGRIYTRWGQFEKALQYLSPRGGWSSLNYAFCMDALGRRDDAMPVYEKLLREAGGTTIGQWATLGLEQPTWPKDLDIAAEPGEARLSPSEHWRVSAWAAEEGTKPELAIDGNRQTEWETRGRTRPQEPGQWFRLDFDSPLVVSRIVLDHYGEKTIYTNEWARSLSASITGDGRNWRDVPVSPAGIFEPAAVKLNPAQRVKSVKFTTTAYHSPEWWGIYEVFVFGPAK